MSEDQGQQGSSENGESQDPNALTREKVGEFLEEGLSRLPDDKSIWAKKWVLGISFLMATSFSFFGFLDAAPAGIFSELATQYEISSPNSTLSDGDLIVNVSSSTLPKNGDPGIEIARGIYSLDSLLLLCLILYVPTVLVYFVCRCSSYEVAKTFHKWGHPFKFRVGNGLLSSIGATLAYGIWILLVWISFSLITGDLTAGRPLYYLAFGIHLVSIFILFYEFTGRLVPDSNSTNPSTYIQTQGYVAQGALSIGLGVAIGGVLTFARAGTQFALPVTFIVGIFLFPLAGIATHRYYRILKTGTKSN